MLADHVVVRADADLRATALLVRRVRRWLDLDADPAAIDDALARRPRARAARRRAARAARAHHGRPVGDRRARDRRPAGVSVAGARTILGRHRRGVRRARGASGFTAFPTAAALAAVDPGDIAALGHAGRARPHACTRSRPPSRPATSTSRAGDPDEVAAALLALPGVGPWTAAYVRLRALGDPDTFPETDLGLRHAARALGLPDRARDLAARAAAWSPWRSYAAQHLWTRPEETP